MVNITKTAVDSGYDISDNSNSKQKNNIVGNLAVGIVGGIVAGAVTKAGATALKFGGRAGMAGIGAGKEFIQNKKAMKNAVEEVTEQAAKDLSVAQQVVKTSVDGTPVTYNFHSNADIFGPAAQQVVGRPSYNSNVAKNIMDFKVGDSSVGISRITNPNSLTASQIKDLAHMDGIIYRSQIRKIDNLTDKEVQNTTSIVSGKLSQQFDDVDMQIQYQNSFYKGIEDSLAIEAKYK